MLTIEQFDIERYNHEKKGFRITDKVFNVSEGYNQTCHDDILSYSQLWRFDLTNKQQKNIFWQEIKQYLPAYLKGEFNLYGYNAKGRFIKHLLIIAEAVKKYGKVKLLYISDRQHCDMISDCINWLLTQI
ncbi:MAG TPA: hypothetical protein VK203_10750 [Nostocaceae cyanobacterium]|nr:hypothetical protein [Nostocaceae cyanobacterium]